MDYPIGLKKDKLISLYLSRLIPINEIRYRVIKMKNMLEDGDTLDYHIGRWSTIAGSHYIAHDTHHNKFSYIFNDDNYVIHADHKMDFYNLTGISYQIVELIHELITIKNVDGLSYQDNIFMAGFKTQKEWFLSDDSLYSKLATLITKEINLKKNSSLLDRTGTMNPVIKSTIY